MNFIRRSALGGLEAPAEPCPRCNVRADVGCKHQPASGVVPLAMTRASTFKPLPTQMRPGMGQGLAFHPGRLKASNVEAAKRSLMTVKRNDD